MKRLVGAALLLALAGAAAWGLAWLGRQIAIDRCLDNGGAWNPVQSSCDLAAPAGRDMSGS